MNQMNTASHTTTSHNNEMNLAWQFIADTGISVFLTGKAGTGKTTFLRKLKELLPKRMVVLAPTGVAAINAGGQTIHSFFQLPFGPFVPGAASYSEGNKKFKMSKQKKNLIRTLDLLVIDEISMVRADLLDQIDDALRRYRDASLPFGGVQLLLIGDLMQLSPVAKADEWQLLSEHYDTPYFFSSRALSGISYVTVELTHIYRQQNREFIDLLAKVRDGNLDARCVNLLNSRYMPGFNPEAPGWIRLTTHNASAQLHNDQRLAMLPAPALDFRAKVSGDFPQMSYPADEVLRLKEGAQVMFVKNDPSGRHDYYNGKIGTISLINGDHIEVVCDDSVEPIKVDPVEWENTRYSIDPDTKAIREEKIGSFIQYPLRLAWAITVHKSQGLTFDRAVLDINASFAHGQTYVALSRCRSLEGLVLSSPISPSSVITDRTVNAFIDSQVASSGDNAAHLPALKLQYTLSLLDSLYSFADIDKALRWLERVVDEHLSNRQPQLLSCIRQLERDFESGAMSVAAKFRPQYQAALIQSGGSIDGTPLAKRIADSAAYFRDKLTEQFGELMSRAVFSIDNKQTAEIYNNALSALRSLLNEKVALFSIFSDRPFSTSAYLNAKAKILLSAEESAPAPRASKKKTKKAAKPEKPQKPEKPKKVVGETLIATLQLFRQGMSAKEIAARRGLSPSTIVNHFAQLAARGDINLDELVTPDHQDIIIRAIRRFDRAFSIAELREAVPADIPYDDIFLTARAYAK